MKRFMIFVLCATLLLAVLTSCVVKDVRDGLSELVPENSTNKPESEKTESDLKESFSFALTWNCHGDSTYDSKTGVLVKQKIATNLDDYTTTLKLSDEQRTEAYEILSQLDYSEYPKNENYNPSDMMSCPDETIILTVRIGGVTRKITAKNIAIMAEGKDKAGKAFLEACGALKEMIYATPEWQSLPEYEFLYE